MSERMVPISELVRQTTYTIVISEILGESLWEAEVSNCVGDRIALAQAPSLASVMQMIESVLRAEGPYD